MIFRIPNQSIEKFNRSSSPSFPKYTSQIINLANQNAQATRPRAVGQLSDLFPEFLSSCKTPSLKYWEYFYNQHHPDAINEAVDRICSQLNNLKQAMELIDRDMVEEWVRDLIINKTYNGLYFQEVILAGLAELKGSSYRLASPHEEAKGIDGFVGNTPYSIKPVTYKTMDRLPESINIKMIYYTKNKTGLTVEVRD